MHLEKSRRQGERTVLPRACATPGQEAGEHHGVHQNFKASTKVPRRQGAKWGKWDQRGRQRPWLRLGVYIYFSISNWEPLKAHTRELELGDCGVGGLPLETGSEGKDGRIIGRA